MTKRPQFPAEAVGYDAPVRNNGVYRILVDMVPGESLAALAPFRLDYCCMPQAQASSRPIQRLHAFAGGATVEAMRKAGRNVEILADAEAESRTAISELRLADEDRFASGSLPPTVGRLI
ncbi:MAG: hypothetical protein AB7V13_18360 [Pseudorhodoplanes sp.]|uniref:hypothetical protein n=1 Tax=Pseudorhodoplanes sp. TaxID=1934341 RepID=UPI003D1291BB